MAGQLLGDGGGWFFAFVHLAPYGQILSTKFQVEVLIRESSKVSGTRNSVSRSRVLYLRTRIGFSLTNGLRINP